MADSVLTISDTMLSSKHKLHELRDIKKATKTFGSTGILFGGVVGAVSYFLIKNSYEQEGDHTVTTTTTYTYDGFGRPIAHTTESKSGQDEKKLSTFAKVGIIGGPTLIGLVAGLATHGGWQLVDFEKNMSLSN